MSGCVAIGRIVGIIPSSELCELTRPSKLKVNLFEELRLSYAPPLPCGVALDTVELCQVQKIEEVQVSHIQKIAFVFTPQSLIEGEYICDGVNDAYVVRYRGVRGTGSTSTDQRVVLSTIEPLPFASMHPGHKFFNTCFSSRIWGDREVLRDTVVKY